MRRALAKPGYALMLMFVIVAVMFGVGVVFVKRTAQDVNRTSDQKWCDLIVTLDDAYRSNPAVALSPVGKKIAESMYRLRQDFGCAIRGPLPTPTTTPTPRR